MPELPFPPLSTAVCPRCDQRMTPGTSCDGSAWPSPDGRDTPAITFGAETFTPDAEACWDCGAPRGGTHHYGCCVEQCPHREQALTCDQCIPLEHDPYAQRPRHN